MAETTSQEGHREALVALERSVAERAALDARMPDLVAVARRAGYTWPAIGMALGLSTYQTERKFGPLLRSRARGARTGP